MLYYLGLSCLELYFYVHFYFHLECAFGDSVTLTPEATIAARGEVITLTCNTALPATFPQWLINNDLFTVTHLPVGFAASDSDLQFTFDGDVDIRCVFRLLSGGSIINICSNLARVVTDGPRGKYFSEPHHVHVDYTEGIVTEK